MRIFAIFLAALLSYQLLAVAKLPSVTPQAVATLSVNQNRLVQAILAGESAIQIRKLAEGLDVNFAVTGFKYQESVVSGTPLSIAAGLGAEETVETLLDIDGIIVDALVITGEDTRVATWKNVVQIQTALGVAVDGSHLGVVKLLVEKGGADVNIDKALLPSHGQSVSVDEGHQLARNTQLIVATEAENLEMVDYLLTNGADPNATASYTNLAPINVSAVTGNIEIAEKLLEYGANVDNWATGVSIVSGRVVSGKGGINGTPLGVAAFLNDINMVELLLNFNADPNYNMFGWGPMDGAIIKENWEIVDKLIKAGGK